MPCHLSHRYLLILQVGGGPWLSRDEHSARTAEDGVVPVSGQIGYSSGFAFQSTYGSGNYEVFIPWPGGGVAHYWYDGTWHGPVLFGSGTVVSVSAMESNWKHQSNGDHGNFELLTLTREDGASRARAWFRDNVSPFNWHQGSDLPGSSGFVSVALGKLVPRKEWPLEYKQYFVAYGSPYNGGLRAYLRAKSEWKEGEVVLERPVTDGTGHGYGDPVNHRAMGIGWAHGTVGARYPDDFEFEPGLEALVYTLPDGVLIFREHVGRNLQGRTVAYPAVKVGNGLNGRPAILQSSRGYSGGTKVPIVVWFDSPRHGNYEVFAPFEGGGVAHFWRGNNEPKGRQWKSAGVVGTENYDEVAAFQNMRMRDGDKTGRINLFAWKRGEKWFHHFIQTHYGDGKFRWDGPETVGRRSNFGKAKLPGGKRSPSNAEPPKRKSPSGKTQPHQDLDPYS